MSGTTTLVIPGQHPAFSGHFPGAPLLPAVVLLDEMLQVVQGAHQSAGHAGVQDRAPRMSWTVATAKFLHPVRPGETLTLEYEPPLPNGAIRFAIRSAGRPVASGTLVPRPAAHEPDHGHETG
jgi:3-hydroxyacyl-[acyl-carrier-protein] dehydratase